MKTTLNLIREHSPCSEGWKKLLRTLGKTKADDEPVSIIQILDINGLDDAFWCLRAVPNRDKEIRLFAVWCARQVEHLMTDDKSIEALNVAERFANGLATREELDAARYAACDAASTAASTAARDAALATASTAAWGVAWVAARAYSATAVYAAVKADADVEAAQEAQLRIICNQIEQQVGDSNE